MKQQSLFEYVLMCDAQARTLARKKQYAVRKLNRAIEQERQEKNL